MMKHNNKYQLCPTYLVQFSASKLFVVEVVDCNINISCLVSCLVHSKSKQSCVHMHSKQLHIEHLVVFWEMVSMAIVTFHMYPMH